MQAPLVAALGRGTPVRDVVGNALADGADRLAPDPAHCRAIAMLAQPHDPCHLSIRPAVPRDPSARAPEPLSEAALALLGKPDVGTRLSETRRGFPHVVNRLAEDWLQPDALLARIDGLLLNDRPNRQGFPLPVVQELGDLRNYYVEHAAPHLRQLQAARVRVTTAEPQRSLKERRRTTGPGFFGRLLGVTAHG